MSKPRCWALLAFTLCAPATQAQIKLEWHFQEGEKFFVERVQTRKQSVQIKNKSFVEQRDKTWVTAVTVREKTPAGFVLDFITISIQEGQTGKHPVAAVLISGGLDEKLALKMKGCRFTATITPMGKVITFAGYDAFLEKLAEKNEELAKTLKVVVSEETLRAEIEELFNFLPEKAVAKGDTWRREALEPMPPFGFIKSSYEYAVMEDDGKEVSIDAKVKMSYKPPSADGDLFRVVKGNLQTEEGKGTLVLDAKKGWLVRSEKNIRFHGELIMEAMGKHIPLVLDSAMTTRVRWLARLDKLAN